ncbi:MAG: Na+/glucose cotransporter, partial [Bacteroidota bacterium]
SILGFLAPPMAVVFLMGVLWKRVTPVAANTILSLGSLISFGIGICSLFGIPNKEFWPHPLLLSFYIFIGLAIFIGIITLVTEKRYAGSPLPSLNKGKVEKGGGKIVWALWIILSFVMVSLYLLFNVIL